MCKNMTNLIKFTKLSPPSKKDNFISIIFSYVFWLLGLSSSSTFPYDNNFTFFLMKRTERNKSFF